METSRCNENAHLIGCFRSCKAHTAIRILKSRWGQKNVERYYVLELLRNFIFVSVFSKYLLFIDIDAVIM